jgi:hypothetical protein
MAIAVGLAIVSPALASPGAAERETARGLMAEGRAARARGDLQSAMKAFAGADAIMHVPTTGFELAKVQAQAGLLVEARDTALRASRLPEADDEPAPFKQARQGAIALEVALDGRIPTIRLTVKNVPAGVRPKVFVDETETPAELLEQPIRVDPGRHVVVAEAGTEKQEQEVDLAEMDSKEITFELEPQEKAPAPAKLAAVSERTEEPAPTTRGSPALVVTGFSIAGAGALAGLVTGIVSISTTNGVKSSGQCQNGGTLCSFAEDGDMSAARTMATLSNVSFLLAGAGAMAGVAGFFVGGWPSASSPSTQKPTEHEPTTSHLRVAPWIGPGSIGMSGSF